MGVGNEGETGTTRSAPEGFISWPDSWQAQGMPWRTEPEIEEGRQRYLAERRAVRPDVEQGIYPFRDESGGIALARADVEWLLATHQSGGMQQGPVDWGDERQRTHAGLDLRGARLQQIDLSGLPLARLLGGLSRQDRDGATVEQRQAAAIHLEGAILADTHLEDAVLSDAHLEGARMGGSFGHRTHLELAKLIEAHLEGADLSYARLDGAAMASVHLEGATLYRADVERAELRGAHLAGASLTRAHFEGALLDQASLAGKRLSSEDVSRLAAAGVPFSPEVPPADLREAFFDPATSLAGIVLGDPMSGWASLADVRWNGVNLAVVDWSAVGMLGDERAAREDARARKSSTSAADVKAAGTSRHARRQARQQAAVERLETYQAAGRATRQLAMALRAQGITDDADRFAYRAQVLRREELRRQVLLRSPDGRPHPARRLRRLASYCGSALLNWIAGYGYRPGRSLIAYIVINCVFAGLYLLNSQFATPHLRWDEALVLSVSSFHGRGFFASGISLGDTLARLAAGEAIIGLLLEITFIATFTNRFFAR